MSTFNERDIACEDCGEDYKGIIWTAVHAAQDPELKEILFGGELNLLMCPKCAHVAYQDHFILYQDPAAELVAYIYPASQQADEAFLRDTMMTNFQEAQAIYPPKDRKDYDPILVFSLARFVEMMAEEEARAEQSQIAQEICKQNGIAFKLLRPCEARQRGIMRVLPRGGTTNDPSRAEVLIGLDQLLKLNPALTLYAQLQKTIQTNDHWTLKNG